MRESSVEWWMFVLIFFHSCTGSGSSVVIESWTACISAISLSLSLLQVCTRRLVKPRGFIDGESEAVMSRWCLPPDPFSERRPGLFWKGSLSHPNELHPADGRDPPHFHTHGIGKINSPPSLLEEQPLRVTVMSGAEQHSTSHHIP